MQGVQLVYQFLGGPLDEGFEVSDSHCLELVLKTCGLGHGLFDGRDVVRGHLHACRDLSDAGSLSEHRLHLLLTLVRDTAGVVVA